MILVSVNEKSVITFLSPPGRRAGQSNPLSRLRRHARPELHKQHSLPLSTAAAPPTLFPRHRPTSSLCAWGFHCPHPSVALDMEEACAHLDKESTPQVGRCHLAWNRSP